MLTKKTVSHIYQNLINCFMLCQTIIACIIFILGAIGLCYSKSEPKIHHSIVVYKSLLCYSFPDKLVHSLYVRPNLGRLRTLAFYASEQSCLI